MSRGIGPVLLTHFTPDEAEADTFEAGTFEEGKVTPAATDEAKHGVLVAPAPAGRTARHRAGRGRRPLVLTTSSGRSGSDTAAGTNRLAVLDQLRNSPKNLRILAMTAGAVVLISIGFGFVRPADQLPGIPIPAGPSTDNGMQPGTLPDAALSGTPTTTIAPPPPTTTTHAAAPPPTHRATTTHAAPPPVTTTQNTQSFSGFDQPGQPCGNPGDFGIDSRYRPVECVADVSGHLTWHEF